MASHSNVSFAFIFVANLLKYSIIFHVNDIKRSDMDEMECFMTYTVCPKSQRSEAVTIQCDGALGESNLDFCIYVQ